MASLSDPTRYTRTTRSSHTLNPTRKTISMLRRVPVGAGLFIFCHAAPLGCFRALECTAAAKLTDDKACFAARSPLGFGEQPFVFPANSGGPTDSQQKFDGSAVNSSRIWQIIKMTHRVRKVVHRLLQKMRRTLPIQPVAWLLICDGQNINHMICAA